MATIGDDAESFSSIDDQKPPGKFSNSFLKGKFWSENYKFRISYY